MVWFINIGCLFLIKILFMGKLELIGEVSFLNVKDYMN